MAISANRAGSNRRLLQALLCVSPALCAGCGSPFEEGDEAWIHVPGEVLVLDEYIVVEIDRFSDRGVEVEPDGDDFRKPLVDEFRSRPRQMTDKLVLELEEEGSEYVDADRLISPGEAEDAYEATREVLAVFDQLELDSSNRKKWDFIANEADADDIQAALEIAEDLEIDEAVTTLEMLLESVEMLSEVGDEEVDEGTALEILAACRRWLDGIFDILDGDDDRLKRLSMDESEQREALKKGRFWALDLVFLMADTLIEVASWRVDNLPISFGADVEIDEMIVSAEALIQFRESVLRLRTADGERRYDGMRIGKLREKYKDELSRKIGAALVDTVDLQEAASLERVEDAYSRLKDEVAERFKDELDLKLLTPQTEIRLHRRAAASLDDWVELALDGNDFDAAAAAVKEYMGVQGALATLYARHDKSKLAAPERRAHLAKIRDRLASRLQPKLREGALAIAGASAQDGDQPAAVEDHVRQWAKPFNAALGREALDEAFLREVREQGELAVRRAAVQVGQVWTGWIQCQETANLRRYKDRAGSRGARYHGVDRMAAKLELLESQGGDLAVARFQGLLTAQNLPGKDAWRQWDPANEAWTNSEKASSSQFVVLTYRPALMTAELGYGVLDRRKHVEKYGQSDHWVSQVDGAWQGFFGSGSVDLDEGSISGRMTRRYIDDTCRTFRFTLGEGASASLPRPEAEPASPASPTGSPPGLGPSSGAAPSASETAQADSPPPDLTSETYIGGVKSRGLQMHGLSANGDWCAEKVVFKITAESGDVFTDGTAKFFVKRFGEQINQPQYCPFAQTADIYGYAGGDQLVFRGTASATDGWTVR